MGGLFYLIFYTFEINKVLFYFSVLLFFFFATTVVASLVDAVIPRKFRIIPPKNKIDLNKFPKLKDTIDDVAKNMKKKPPTEAYLNFSVNAGVSEHGGILGMGRHRSIIIGVPLLSGLNVSEFKAVLAHELGHYGGLLRIGQAINKTRFHVEASINVVKENSGILHLPFVVYRKFFLKVTKGLFRTQELYADYIASKYLGADTVINTLNKIDELNALFPYYWSSEIDPILNQLYRPPVIDGFARFKQSPEATKVMPILLNRTKQLPKKDNNDPHPSSKERVAAVSQTKFKQPELDMSPAIRLINVTSELELGLLLSIPHLTENIIDNLKPITWDEVGNNLWRKIIEEYIRKHKEIFENITLGEFTGFVSNPDKLLNQLKKNVNAQDDKKDVSVIAETVEEKSFRVQKILIRALIYILLRDGWQGKYVIGKDVVLFKNNEEVCPAALLRQLFSSGPS
jgi:heat shock protein HtpX